MKKELYNIEVINTVAAINKLISNQDKVKELPIKIRWAIKKNMSVFSPTVKNFDDMRQELVSELQAEYFNEEKSHVEEMELEDGKKEEFRKVNDEYMEEYEAKVNELNAKLQEVLTEKNEYDIYTVNLDEFVQHLGDDTALDFDDIDVLSFMDE